MANLTDKEKFIARFLRQEQGTKEITRYVLRHAGKGKQGVEIETFEITEALTPDELDMLAGTICARAQMDADGIGPTIQRYTLTSYLADPDPEKSGKAQGRLSFRLKGETDLDLDEDAEGGEEAPNQRGLLQQLMRHNEANNRTLVGSAAGMMNAMSRRLESQDGMLEKMMEERTKMLEIVEAAKTSQAERDMAMYIEKSHQARIDVGVRKIALLAPVALDHFTGGKLGAKDTPMSLMLKELAGSMTSEQMQHIAKALAPEQQIVFFRLLQSLQPAKEETEQLAEKGDANGTDVS